MCLLGYYEYELLIKTGLLIKVGISSDRLYRIWFLWLQLWNSSTLTKLLKITLKDDNFFTYVHNVSNITYFCKRSANITMSRASTSSCDGKIWKRDYSLMFPREFVVHWEERGVSIAFHQWCLNFLLFMLFIQQVFQCLLFF